MSADILVTPSELRDHAGHIEGEASKMTDQLAALRSRLQQLGGQFRGKAATAFDSRYEEWNTNANGLLQALDSLGKYLRTSADTIEDVDAQIASNLQ